MRTALVAAVAARQGGVGRQNLTYGTRHHSFGKKILFIQNELCVTSPVTVFVVVGGPFADALGEDRGASKSGHAEQHMDAEFRGGYAGIGSRWRWLGSPRFAAQSLL